MKKLSLGPFRHDDVIMSHYPVDGGRVVSKPESLENLPDAEVGVEEESPLTLRGAEVNTPKIRRRPPVVLVLFAVPIPLP